MQHIRACVCSACEHVHAVVGVGREAIAIEVKLIEFAVKHKMCSLCSELLSTSALDPKESSVNIDYTQPNLYTTLLHVHSHKWQLNPGNTIHHVHCVATQVTT